MPDSPTCPWVSGCARCAVLPGYPLVRAWPRHGNKAAPFGRRGQPTAVSGTGHFHAVPFHRRISVLLPALVMVEPTAQPLSAEEATTPER